MIFSFLDAPALVSCSKVCKTLHGAAESDAAWHALAAPFIEIGSPYTRMKQVYIEFGTALRAPRGWKVDRISRSTGVTPKQDFLAKICGCNVFLSDISLYQLQEAPA